MLIINCPKCIKGRIIKDFMVPMYAVATDRGLIAYETTSYELGEADGCFYCEGCGYDLHTGEIYDLIEKLQEETNE
jgi:uncharacterized protein (DUF983 family)